MANLSSDDVGEIDEGHIVKARYTPVQHTVLAVEEKDSPERGEIEEFATLNSMPVVIGQLHSQLAPAAGAIKRLSNGRARVAYIMTDSAALPLDFSRQVHELRGKGLIDSTITVGQAFGGEIEAVNIYTGLIAAKQVAGADAVIVCPGPGNVGTGTLYGFSSIEQGEIVNAVNVLGGSAIAVARISFADPRPRHQGLSHHTITSLGRVALTKCILALPMIDQMRLLAIQEHIRPHAHFLQAQSQDNGRPPGNNRASGEGRQNAEHGPVFPGRRRFLPRRLGGRRRGGWHAEDDGLVLFESRISRRIAEGTDYDGPTSPDVGLCSRVSKPAPT